MDEKEFTKKAKAQVKAIGDFRAARSQADRQMHSEGKTWAYDHKSGSLKQNKGE